MKTAYGNVCSLSCQCIDLIGKVFEENFETAFPGAVSWSIIDGKGEGGLPEKDFIVVGK